MKKEGYAPSDMTHLGDNIISDVVVPHRMGIKSADTNKKEMKKMLFMEKLYLMKKRIFKPIRIFKACLKNGKN